MILIFNVYVALRSTVATMSTGGAVPLTGAVRPAHLRLDTELDNYERGRRL